MMPPNEKLSLDKDTHSLHPAHALRTLLCYCHKRARTQQQLSWALLSMLFIHLQFTNKELYSAHASLWVSPFHIHHEVLTLTKNVPKPLTLSEN